MNLSHLFKNSPYTKRRTDSFDRELIYRNELEKPLNYPVDLPWLGETDENFVYKWVPMTDPSDKGYNPKNSPASMGRKGYTLVKSIEFPHLNSLSQDMRASLNLLDRQNGNARERDYTQNELYIIYEDNILMKIERDLYDILNMKDRKFAEEVNKMTTENGFNENEINKAEKKRITIEAVETNQTDFNSIY